MDNQLEQAAIAYAASLVRYFDIVQNKHSGVMEPVAGAASAARDELLLAEQHLFKIASEESAKRLAAM